MLAALIGFAGHPAYLQNNWNNTELLVAGPQSGSEFSITGPTPTFLSDSKGRSLDTNGDGTGFATTTLFWSSTGRFNVASPATITVDPGAVRRLLVRLIEPWSGGARAGCALPAAAPRHLDSDWGLARGRKKSDAVE